MKTDYKNKNIHIVGISGMEGLAVWQYFKSQISNFKSQIYLHDFSENLETLKQSLFAYHDYLGKQEKERVWRELEQEKDNIRLREDYLKGVEEADIIFVPQSWFRYPANAPLYDLKGQVKFKQLTQLYFETFVGIIVGITGSSGKSTTANLIYHLIRYLPRRRVWLSGNDRNNPPVLNKIQDADKDDILVLEISNRQLIDLEYSPQVAVVSTLSPTHIDDHKTFTHYLEAKVNIVKYQDSKDLAILNYDNKYVRAFAHKTKAKVEWFGLNSALNLKGAFLEDDNLVFDLKKKEAIMPLVDFPLPGEHNLSNALAASLVARHFGLKPADVSRKLRDFKGLKHRLELVAKSKGVEFYNDSQATNAQAAQAAIESFPGRNKIIIAGGRKKDNPKDFKPWLKSLIKNEVRALLLIGEAGGQIHQELKKITKKAPFLVKDCGKMQQAVEEVFGIMKKGDAVLMSPACESFGEFKDYRERGERFREEVNAQIRNSKHEVRSTK